MDETRYHTEADAFLSRCYDALDAAFDAAALEDLELQNGILTIITAMGRTYVLSKHGVTRQLWLAERSLGGLHFVFEEASKQWKLPDGRELAATLADALTRDRIEIAL